MSKLSNVLKLGAAVVAIVLVGLLIGWLGSSRHPSAAPDVDPPPASTPRPDEPIKNNHPSVESRPVSALPAEAMTNESARAVPSMPSDLITNWSDRLENILTSSVEEADKAKQMLEMFPHLPPDGQAEVARHLSNLTPDSDYAALGKYLTDPKMPEAVLEVLLADALNRPNTVKLPLLLEVARQTDHAKAVEAKGLLELFLEEDHGKDWIAWQAKLDQWLKDNPD